MRVKLDENLGRRTINLFREAGHEVATVFEQDLGGTPDADLLELCRVEGRFLVTLDLDFANVLRFPPARFAGIAVLRAPHPIKLDTLHQHIQILIKGLEQKELAGRLWIVESDRIREYEPEA